MAPREVHPALNPIVPTEATISFTFAAPEANPVAAQPTVPAAEGQVITNPMNAQQAAPEAVVAPVAEQTSAASENLARRTWNTAHRIGSAAVDGVLGVTARVQLAGGSWRESRAQNTRTAQVAAQTNPTFWNRIKYGALVGSGAVTSIGGAYFATRALGAAHTAGLEVGADLFGGTTGAGDGHVLAEHFPAAGSHHGTLHHEAPHVTVAHSAGNEHLEAVPQTQAQTAGNTLQASPNHSAGPVTGGMQTGHPAPGNTIHATNPNVVPTNHERNTTSLAASGVILLGAAAIGTGAVLRHRSRRNARYYKVKGKRISDRANSAGIDQMERDAVQKARKFNAQARIQPPTSYPSGMDLHKFDDYAGKLGIGPTPQQQLEKLREEVRQTVPVAERHAYVAQQTLNYARAYYRQAEFAAADAEKDFKAGRITWPELQRLRNEHNDAYHQLAYAQANYERSRAEAAHPRTGKVDDRDNVVTKRVNPDVLKFKDYPVN